jgi:hypothetical protein
LIIAVAKSSKGIFKLRNISLFLYVVFALPYINIVYKNPVIKDISIPPFMLTAIIDNKFYIVVFFILSSLILICIFYKLGFRCQLFHNFISLLSNPIFSFSHNSLT